MGQKTGILDGGVQESRLATDLPLKTNRVSGQRARFAFLLVFLLLAAGIVVTGWLYSRNYEKQFRAGIERQLSAIADLKAGDLAQYRKERLEDGSLFFQNAPFAALVRRYLEKPEDADAQRQLEIWIGKYRPYYGEVLLLDAQGVTRLSLPAGLPAVSASVAMGISEVLRSGQMTIQDFYRGEQDQRIHLGVLVPIFDEKDAGRPLGVVFLRIDPETWLYPFIKRWPTASLTAETLLVRPEGNEAVFLNELRFQTNTALNLRLPLDRVALPAAQAASGREGFMEGVDYRGVPAVAALRAIPDSPWSLVARMDATEAYQPMREQLWQVALMTGALFLGAGAFVGLVRRQQRVRFYRERGKTTEALRVSEVRYRRLFEEAQDGILILDTQTGMVLDVNPFLIELLGYSREAFLGKRVWELGFFKDIVANQANFAELQQKRHIRYEDKPLETSDGRRIEVEFVSNVCEAGEQRVIQCNIRDITQRIWAEDVLSKAGALQTAIFNSTHFSSIATDAKGVIQIFNVGAERMLGYAAADVMNKITPADISDPQEVIARAKALSVELATPIMPGFEALVFKASRDIEDIYELTYIRKDGSRFPAVVSVTALRDAQNAIIGYLLISTDNTARKQVEDDRMKLDQDLRDQQFYTRSLIESNIDALMTTNPRGIISDVNKQMEMLTGCTRDELIGAPFKNYFTDPERAEAGIKLVLSEKKVTNYEMTAISKDGKKTVVSYNATTFYDRDRRLQGVFAAARDITERKEAEEALFKAGALQNAIFNSVNFSSIATDAKGVIQIFNVGAERMLGYAAADVMNKITPADISDPQEVIARAKALSVELATPITPGFEALVFKASRGIEDIYELTYIRKDGSRFPAVVSVTALRDAQNAIIGYLLIGTDNTARKRAEDEAKAHLAAIVECSEDAIVGKDLQGVVTSWNLGAEKTFGYSVREMAGQSITRIIPPECQQQEVEVLSRIQRGENLPHFETMRVRKDASIVEISIAISLIKDLEGKVVGASEVMRDITEHKRAQERIHQLNIELERRVTERTVQLEAANKELEAFSYSVSHDLRAPLRAVDGFSQVVLEDYGPQLPEGCRQDLQTIRKGAQKMGVLIDDLLTFSRLSRLPLSKKTVDTGKLVHGVLEELNSQRNGQRIDLRVADLPPCQADPALLKHVWVNLLSNALKYTGKCESALVEIGCVMEKGRNVYFVRDNGAGFDMKYAHKLFGVFQRLHRAEDYEGTGVGLAIVQHIIHRHGGRIWAESEVNCGATFYFTLEGETKL
jgi:PAS domain S-box-containing protein